MYTHKRNFHIISLKIISLQSKTKKFNLHLIHFPTWFTSTTINSSHHDTSTVLIGRNDFLFECFHFWPIWTCHHAWWSFTNRTVYDVQSTVKCKTGMYYFDCKQKKVTHESSPLQRILPVMPQMDIRWLTVKTNHASSSIQLLGGGRQKCLLQNTNAYSHYHRWHWQTSTYSTQLHAAQSFFKR